MHATRNYLAILAIGMLSGCAAADGEREAKYEWQQVRDAGGAIHPECDSRIRRTGSRIPRCRNQSNMYGKAYHTPGASVDDRTGRRRR